MINIRRIYDKSIACENLKKYASRKTWHVDSHISEIFEIVNFIANITYRFWQDFRNRNTSLLKYKLFRNKLSTCT